MIVFEFLDPAVPEARSTFAHCSSGWFLAFAVESAPMHVTLTVSAHVVAVRLQIFHIQCLGDAQSIVAVNIAVGLCPPCPRSVPHHSPVLPGWKSRNHNPFLHSNVVQPRLSPFVLYNLRCFLLHPTCPCPSPYHSFMHSANLN